MSEKTNKLWQTSWWPELLTAFLVISFFLLSVDLYQYLTTEVWWLWDQTSYNQNTVYLLVLIVASTWLPMKSWLARWPKLGLMLVGLFLVTLVAHRQYTVFYDQLQQYPRVKGLSKEWGIAWSYVKVTGRNFGGEWEPGKVYLGEAEMIVRKWTPTEIIFEIAAEAEVGEQELRVVNSHEQSQQQQVIFEVREHAN